MLLPRALERSNEIIRINLSADKGWQVYFFVLKTNMI